jgi:hypothetical protein
MFARAQQRFSAIMLWLIVGGLTVLFWLVLPQFYALQTKVVTLEDEVAVQGARLASFGRGSRQSASKPNRLPPRKTLVGNSCPSIAPVPIRSL